MAIKIYSKEQQAYGAFNGGEIVENKPLGFPQDGGELRPYSNIFYWANAVANKDSTIGLHPHQGFEILSFVLEGRIRHYDNKMDDWKWLKAGDVQVIQSGNGIKHAEHMEKGARMFQIWLDPNLSQSLEKEARYKDYKASSFDRISEEGIEKTIFSGKSGLLNLDAQDVEFGRIDLAGKNYTMEVDNSQVLSIYVLNGNPTIAKQATKEHDFVLIGDMNEKLALSGTGEIFYIISPKRPYYATYSEMMQRRMKQ